jgi:hypothetical protein
MMMAMWRGTAAGTDGETTSDGAAIAKVASFMTDAMLLLRFFDV